MPERRRVGFAGAMRAGQPGWGRADVFGVVRLRPLRAEVDPPEELPDDDLFAGCATISAMFFSFSFFLFSARRFER